MRKPRIGILGIMQELYDAFIPGITERQESYARDVAAQLADVADCHFPRAARNRADIEAVMDEFNAGNYDGVLMMNLCYGPGLNLYNALRDNRLPLMIANIQPVPTVTDDWDMNDLTYNQGVHGAQDTANAVMRAGIQCPIISEDWRSEAFKTFVRDWAAAARTVRELRRTKIAAIGQMTGMGDILSDHALVMSKLGPQIDQVNTGLIYAEFEKATDEEVQAVMDENRANFEIDANLKDEDHAYAARFQVAISKILTGGGYSGFSFYFNAPAEDGRFRQLPLMASSNLLAKGYGYAAEGDTTCCTLVTAGHLLEENSQFTEMYAMDFERNSALMSHMGEGNWKIARPDRPIRLVDRPLGIGGLDNPPTIVFMGQPGPATLTDLVATNDGNFRLIVSRGDILDTPEMPNVEMPYYHFRPESGVRACLDAWLANGGSHHQCLHLGDLSRRWQMLARMLDIECVTV